MSAPPARAPKAPSAIRPATALAATQINSPLVGAMATVARGKAAPAAKVAADVNAAWTGRAVVKLEMPNSSRA